MDYPSRKLVLVRTSLPYPYRSLLVLLSLATQPPVLAPDTMVPDATIHCYPLLPISRCFLFALLIVFSCHYP